MRFILYKRAQVRGCKIDWDAPVELTDEIRRAMQPHVVEELRAGRLRRPFEYKAGTPGRRSRRVFEKHPPPESVAHERGAVVFAYPDESVFFIEAVQEQ